MIDENALERVTKTVLSYNPKAVFPNPIGEGLIKIGEIEIPCAVLPNGVRVLTLRGMMLAINSKKTQFHEIKNGDPKTRRFQFPSSLIPFVNNELIALLNYQEFQPIKGGRTAYGIRAEALPLICELFIEAKEKGALRPSQIAMADRCRTLQNGFARLGIVALVDEATGYQENREKDALAQILEKFIADELQLWTKTFPLDFYEQICRLKKWPGIHAVQRPSVIGKYTNDFVYQRIAPELLKELQRRNPTLPDGGRKHKHHQWLGPDYGHQRLREHLAGVMALMRAAPSWDRFKRNLDAAYPKFGETIPLLLDESEE